MAELLSDVEPDLPRPAEPPPAGSPLPGEVIRPPVPLERGRAYLLRVPDGDVAALNVALAAFTEQTGVRFLVLGPGVEIEDAPGG